jgi:nucleotide-binding universal stress UspA family protein
MTVVLVPLDGSKSGLRALPIARRLAELKKVPVRMLHVSDETGPLRQRASAIGLEEADLRGAILDVRAGRPAETILAAAADCDATLIVMCGHAADAQLEAEIGAVALAVLREARCPVVLVDPDRAPAGWTLKRILAAHDGSPSISGALAPAAELAREAAAELVVLHVADETRARETGSIAPPVYMDQLQHGWPAWSGEFLQRLACVCPVADAQVRLLVAHGDPADETVRVAGEESADLIVLACCGGWEARHAAALKTLLRGAPCPVMVTCAA